jgi:cell division protein FtsI (penicillin-binding protein 3)
MRLGSNTDERAAALYDSWTRFGLTQPTGTDLPAESAGLSRDPASSHWAEIDLANASFGQGVSVTGLQLTCAYGALVNGGIVVRPQVARGIGTTPYPIVARGKAISPATSATMRGLLRYVIEEHYDVALVPGYLVGGKTGTAEIYDAEKGEWATNRLDFSLYGFMEDATGHRYMISVVIRDGRNWARGTYALPYRTALFFRDAVRAVGKALDLPKIKTKAGALWHQETDPTDSTRLPVGETIP